MPEIRIDPTRSVMDFSFREKHISVMLRPPINPIVVGRGRNYEVAASCIYLVSSLRGPRSSVLPIRYHVFDLLTNGSIFLRKNIPSDFPFPLLESGHLKICLPRL